MDIKTNLKPKNYNLKEVNRICNVKQQIFYISNGVYPIDIYTSIDERNNRKIIVMIFERLQTKELYERWCRYDVNIWKRWYTMFEYTIAALKNYEDKKMKPMSIDTLNDISLKDAEFKVAKALAYEFGSEASNIIAEAILILNKSNIN